MVKKSTVLLLSMLLLFVSLGTASASTDGRNLGFTSLVDINGVKDINLDKYFSENLVPAEKSGTMNYGTRINPKCSD